MNVGSRIRMLPAPLVDVVLRGHVSLTGTIEAELVSNDDPNSAIELTLQASAHLFSLRQRHSPIPHLAM